MYVEALQCFWEDALADPFMAGFWGVLVSTYTSAARRYVEKRLHRSWRFWHVI